MLFAIKKEGVLQPKIERKDYVSIYINSKFNKQKM